MPDEIQNNTNSSPVITPATTVAPAAVNPDTLLVDSAELQSINPKKSLILPSIIMAVLFITSFIVYSYLNRDTKVIIVDVNTKPITIDRSAGNKKATVEEKSISRKR